MAENGKAVIDLATWLEEGELVGSARLAEATPLWDWIGGGACVLRY